MRGIVTVLVVVGGAGFLWWWYVHMQQPKNLIDIKNFYDLSIQDIYGDKLLFSSFVGKKVLIVNIASRCGFTEQLGSLQNLYELYHDRLVILGVPCDQFLSQSPENEADMQLFCEKEYGVTFPLTEKIHVRGPEQHPVYQWLTHARLNGVKSSVVKRNFQKYLIDESGRLVTVFAPNVLPFADAIVDYLK
jgi:glutathione peroxidase